MSLSPLLIRLAAHPPESIAVIGDDGVKASYGALARRSAAAANALTAQGVRAGRTVAFLVEPGVLYVETLLAIWRAGGLAVPLSPLHTAPELAHLVRDAAPLVLVASEALAPRLAGLASPPAGQAALRAEALASFPTGGAEPPLPRRGY